MTRRAVRSVPTKARGRVATPCTTIPVTRTRRVPNAPRKRPARMPALTAARPGMPKTRPVMTGDSPIDCWT